MLDKLIIRIQKLTKAGLLKWRQTSAGFRCQCGDNALELRSSVSLKGATVYHLWDAHCHTVFQPTSPEGKNALEAIVDQLVQVQLEAANLQVQSAAEHWMLKLQAPEYSTVE
jgi:hypothetical protein